MYPKGAPIPRPQATCPSKTEQSYGIRDDPEIAISDHLKNIPIEHPGQKRVRIVADTFEAFGPHGTHKCLLYRSLGMTFAELLGLLPEQELPKELFQSSLQLLLLALDYLHQCDVAHTGIGSMKT